MRQPLLSPDSVTSAMVARCLTGNREAERELYDATIGGVYRLTQRMVGANDAEDVCQQIYLQVFTKLDTFDKKAAFSTWLYRVAVNECLQHLRRRRLKTTSLSDCDLAQKGPATELHGNKELIDRALAVIDPDLKTIFLLRELEGFSYGKLAELLDLPIGTVGSRISRARSELRSALCQLGWEPS